MDKREQRAAYEQALKRADANGVSIMAVGEGLDGVAYYFVNSASDPTADWHRVWIDGGHFNCTCSGGTHGKLCTHKAVVRRQYIAEREEAPQAVETLRQSQPSRPRLVTFDGRGGRGSKCATCNKAFVVGEDIALIDGAAHHPECVTGSTAVGATAPRRNDKPFSILK